MAKSVKNNFTASSLQPLKNNGKLVSEAEEKANTRKPMKMPSFNQSMNAIVFRSCIVKKYLQQLDAKKTTGPDGFPSIIL